MWDFIFETLTYLWVNSWKKLFKKMICHQSKKKTNYSRVQIMNLNKIIFGKYNCLLWLALPINHKTLF